MSEPPPRRGGWLIAAHENRRGELEATSGIEPEYTALQAVA